MIEKRDKKKEKNIIFVSVFFFYRFGFFIVRLSLATLSLFRSSGARFFALDVPKRVALACGQNRIALTDAEK